MSVTASSGTPENLAVAFAEIKDLQGWQLTRNICAAVCWHADERKQAHGYPEEISDAEAKNPFIRILLWQTACYCCTSSPYAGLAKIFLDQSHGMTPELNQANPKSPASSLADEEFISLETFIAMNTGRPDLQELPREVFDEEEEGAGPVITRVLWEFFDRNRQCLDQGIEHACIAVNQGVPIHVFAPTPGAKLDPVPDSINSFCADGTYEAVPFSHEMNVYLRMKLKHGECSSAGLRNEFNCPDWADEYYFKVSHLKARERLYGNMNWNIVPPTALPVLRSALWREIGFDNTDDPPPSEVGVPQSSAPPYRAKVPRLFEITQKAMSLYNADGSFGPRRQGSGKLQKTVTNWAREQGVLADQHQKAIYIVTRPDGSSHDE